jgi:riboflavin kinase / FMN adenylyltransferase
MSTYTGIVQKGSKVAGSLGFPTVNIPLPDEGVSGVYAATVKVGEEKYEAMVFADSMRHLLEAHLLDFEADLYGWNIAVTLHEKIRGRKKFKNDTVTKKQLVKDVEAVRAYFRKTG